MAPPFWKKMQQYMPRLSVTPMNQNARETLKIGQLSFTEGFIGRLLLEPLGDENSSTHGAVG